MQGVEKQKKSKLTVWLTVVLVLLVLVIFYILGEYVNTDEDGASKNTQQTNRHEDDGDDYDAQEDDDVETDRDEQSVTDMDAHTIMVYCVGSDLSRWACLDILEMGVDLGEEVNVVIQAGGAKSWELDGLPDGEAVRMDVVDSEICIREYLGQIDMVANETLVDFIKYSESNYPAEKYTLVLWDHGGGAPVGFGKDMFYPGTIVDYELQDVLEEADVYFESIFMDACLMATLEMAMAVKDYANYMIACETIETTAGTYYEEAFTYLAKHPDATGKEYGAIIVDNYMSAMREKEAVGTMSVIDLSKVQKVYEAYVEYIQEVAQQYDNENIVDYLKVRKFCGYISGADTVDIITLANSGYNSKSDDLIKATEDAIYISESEYDFTHGLGVYFPCSLPDKYTSARNSLSHLGYDEDVISFYDDFASVLCCAQGEQYVSDYAGSWYNQTLAESLDIFSLGEKFDISLDGSSMVLDIGSDITNMIRSCEVRWTLTDQANSAHYVMGSEYIGSVNDKGQYVVDLPASWLTVNGQLITFIVCNRYSNPKTGEWSVEGTIPAICNDNYCLLYVTRDNQNPSGVISGYMLCDSSYSMPVDWTVRALDKDDKLQLTYINILEDGTSKNVIVQQIEDATDIKLEYRNLLYDNITGEIWWKIIDIYGRTYNSYSYTIESIWESVKGN